jgi:hypothetical protein
MEITIDPSNPSSDDSVQIVFSVSDCVDSTNQEQLGTEFELTVNLSEVCVATPPLFSHSWNVGRLTPGEYSATLTASDGDAETQAFTVSQGTLPLPVSVPALGLSGLALLALAFAVIANKSLQRTRECAGR